MALYDRPADCGLALAIPLTRNDFEGDLTTSVDKEYARLQKRQLGELSSDDLWAYYEQIVVSPARAAIEYVRSRGVYVELGLTTKRLKQMLEEKSVVTVFAHWRQGGFTRELICNASGCVADIRNSRTPMGRALAGQLPASILDAKSLADYLNASLRKIFIVEDDAVNPHAEWLMSCQQQNLDRNFEVFRIEFSTWNLPPIGMELADGIQSVADLVQIVSPAWAGTLDLRMCNSILLGEVIKRVAPQGQVMMNRNLTGPEIQLAFYKQTIHLLETGNADYAGVVTELRKAVLGRHR